MKTTLLFSIILLLASCQTIEYPNRPVAYIYPTIRTMDEIAQYSPLKATPADVREALEKADAYNALLIAGLQQSELEIVVRGLAKHGYAEIDARRCRGRVKLVAVYHDGNGKVALDIVWR